MGKEEESSSPARVEAGLEAQADVRDAEEAVALSQRAEEA